MGMTNKEKTLDWLYRLRSEIYVYMPKEWLIPMADALDVAIKALETLEEFEKAQIIMGGRLNGRTYAYKCGLEDGKRKALEQEPKWIPVSERLPDTDDEVLCWYEYYHWSQEKVLPEYGIGCYLKETSAWFGEVANGKDVRVLAWMPLPKAYREVEE